MTKFGGNKFSKIIGYHQERDLIFTKTAPAFMPTKLDGINQYT